MRLVHERRSPVRGTREVTRYVVENGCDNRHGQQVATLKRIIDPKNYLTVFMNANGRDHNF